ncbi:hypothetical protein LJC32_04905 [Oscillospiraceae bacterium OttesenSCG-928-F05]|nr:hypothetical protein [Oscillospiraceae bacterium OttesenSCG-928-F05]
MLRENNEALIKAIEAGIKKEVSIGCSVEKSLCSICGNDITDRTKCTHIKGMRYPIGGEEKLCYAELDDATDVYEWSFVAVPAQRRAGVMKAFDAKGGETLTYSEKIAQLAGRDEALLKELKKLETEAATGRLYLEELRRETKRLSGLSGLGIDPETFGSVADRMTPEELKAFKSAFEQRAGARYIGKAQIAGEETLPAATDDGFMI